MPFKPASVKLDRVYTIGAGVYTLNLRPSRIQRNEGAVTIKKTDSLCKGL